MSEQPDLEKRVRVVAEVLGTLIAWISQSANAPISVTEARELLRRLEGDGDDE